MSNLIFELYCDESRQDLLAGKDNISNNNMFVCLGGIMIEASSRNRIKASINQIKQQYGIHNEIKWTTVSPSKLQFYFDLIDVFFDAQELSFRTVVIDASKVNNFMYNKNDQELGYYKFYYQLLYHWINKDNKYRVYTDQKTNRDKMRLKELKRIVNLGFNGCEPIQSIQAIDSYESVILQIQNILMGAVGYKYNYRHNGKSAAKEDVVRKIEERLHKSICPTGPFERKFNIFEICLREGC